MTMRIALSLIAIFFCINIYATKVYKIAIASSCPYHCNYEDRDGYIVELLEEFFKEHKIKIEVVTVPYARLNDSLKRGVFDLAVFTSFDLRNYSDLVIYDITLGVSSAGIISRAGSNPVIIDIQDLKDKSIFLAYGSKASENLYEKLKKINTGKSSPQYITGSKIHTRLIDLVLRERAEYAIDDYNILKYVYSRSPNKDKIILTPSSISGYSPLKIASLKSLPIKGLIKKDLKKFIIQYRKSGKLKKLLAKYNIIDWNLVLTR